MGEALATASGGDKVPIAADELIHSYARASTSANSLRAFQSDCARLFRWGGPLPWTPNLTARYLAHHADSLKVATLNRHLVSLARAHRLEQHGDPTKTELVRMVMRGVRRTHGIAQKQAKPILIEDLQAMTARMGGTPRDVRDRALILLGFAGALRRSELVALDFEDIEEVRQGMIVLLRKAKTDQDGRGRKIAIPYGRTNLCPVAALEAWVAVSGLRRGPVFTSFETAFQPATMRLSAESVALILRSRLRAAGYNPAPYSGHSLRAGLATSAAMAGVSAWKIRAQTGHSSDAMLGRYIRDGELWIGNAAGAVL